MSEWSDAGKGAVGGAATGATGATAGSAVSPGWGTLIGGVVGAVAGGVGGYMHGAGARERETAEDTAMAGAFLRQMEAQRRMAAIQQQYQQDVKETLGQDTENWRQHIAGMATGEQAAAGIRAYQEAGASEAQPVMRQAAAGPVAGGGYGQQMQRAYGARANQRADQAQNLGELDYARARQAQDEVVYSRNYGLQQADMRNRLAYVNALKQQRLGNWEADIADNDLAFRTSMRGAAGEGQGKMSTGNYIIGGTNLIGGAVRSYGSAGA